jgi:hypothetical protein
MDTDREINAIKKLIPSATGDNLIDLNQRLNILLKKKQDEERSRQRSIQEDTVEPDTQPPSLLNKENAKAVKIIKIDTKTVNDLYLNSDGVKDFMNKCLEHVMTNFTKDENVLKLIKLKCYVQVKVIFEYYHAKPYESTFKTIKKPFYTDMLIQRSNLVQSVEDLKTVVEKQSKKILCMIDNFENQSSNWVIVKPLAFKLRFIGYTNRINRARGFIPTPAWLNGRKAIINIQNKDENCFFKCIYRFFNRDKHQNDSKV